MLKNDPIVRDQAAIAKDARRRLSDLETKEYTAGGITEAEADALYAPIAKGVTNGDTHDHSGGDGAQVNHTTLSNIGSNSHATIDSHIAATAAHGVTGAVVGTGGSQTLTNKTLTAPVIADFTAAQHDHGDADDGGLIPYTSLTGTPTIPSQYTDELAQDAVGAMVDGNTETDIAVTYDDAGGKLNFVVSPTLVGDRIHAAADKATPVDADELGLADSAATWALKHLTWANLKAALTTLFNGLYILAAGKAGGQTVPGGNAASEDLTLTSTTDATKRKIYLGADSVYDELNSRLGIGDISPLYRLVIRHDAESTGGGTPDPRIAAIILQNNKVTAPTGGNTAFVRYSFLSDGSVGGGVPASGELGNFGYVSSVDAGTTMIIANRTASDAASIQFATRDGTHIVKLTGAGLLQVGPTAPTAKLHVDQASTTGAVPVLILDQADLSEELIEFISTAGAGNAIDTAALGAYQGKIRITVNGSYFYIPYYL